MEPSQGGHFATGHSGETSMHSKKKCLRSALFCNRSRSQLKEFEKAMNGLRHAHCRQAQCGYHFHSYKAIILNHYCIFMDVTMIVNYINPDNFCLHHLKHYCFHWLIQFPLVSMNITSIYYKPIISITFLAASSRQRSRCFAAPPPLWRTALLSAARLCVRPCQEVLQQDGLGGEDAGELW